MPEDLGGTETLIGALVTASEITTSNWGDEHMYFRHQRMEEDLTIRPEWKECTPKQTDIYLQLQDNSNNPECPFSHLLQYL